jgi:hypothetical protein
MDDDTITGENLLTLKTNIEMKLGRKLQEMGFTQREEQNCYTYLSWKCPPCVTL